MKKITNMVSSVRNRLLEMARRKDRPFEEILVLYGLERFLFRLSQSSHKRDFILKGGLLIYGMELSEARPTRDIDLLGLTQNDVEAVSEMIQEIGKIDFDDGMMYDFDQLTHETMAPDSEYPGIRFKFVGKLGKNQDPNAAGYRFWRRCCSGCKRHGLPYPVGYESPHNSRLCN